MSVPQEIIALLCDEAYLKCCLDFLTEEKSRINAEKHRISITDDVGFEEEANASVQDLVQGEEAIDERLRNIEVFDIWIKALIRDRLQLYMAEVSDSRRRGLKIGEAIMAWDQLLEDYGSQLTALVRNIKNLVLSFASGRSVTQSAFAIRAQALAELRMSADSIDTAALRIEALARTVSDLASIPPFRDLRLPELPNKRIVGWIDGLMLEHDQNALSAAQAMDADARRIIKNISGFREYSASATGAIASIENQELETYWSTLRDYTLAHYIKDFDVDDVINRMSERYTSEQAACGQTVMEGAYDPYA